MSVEELTDGLLRATLVILHGALWLREAVTYTLLWVWTGIAYSIKHKGTKLECIVKDTKHLRKLPWHLAVIIQETTISCDDLARVTTWAFASGVKLVSLYDPNGSIGKEMAALQNRIHLHRKKLFSSPMPDIEVISTSGQSPPSLPPLSQLHGNGPCRVAVVSVGGHQSLVDVAVSMCQSALARELIVEQLDTATIDNRITNSLNLPDPQVALVFGSVCSTVGFPPWQLRLTEIHTLPTHHKLPYQQFLKVLQKYSSCEQRHGK